MCRPTKDKTLRGIGLSPRRPVVSVGLWSGLVGDPEGRGRLGGRGRTRTAKDHSRSGSELHYGGLLGAPNQRTEHRRASYGHPPPPVRLVFGEPGLICIVLWWDSKDGGLVTSRLHSPDVRVRAPRFGEDRVVGRTWTAV